VSLLEAIHWALTSVQLLVVVLASTSTMLAPFRWNVASHRHCSLLIRANVRTHREFGNRKNWSVRIVWWHRSHLEPGINDRSELFTGKKASGSHWFFFLRWCCSINLSWSSLFSEVLLLCCTMVCTVLFVRVEHDTNFFLLSKYD
jgi:hypothetical protein